MEESYIEGRFGIVMEEIRDELAKIAEALEKLASCINKEGRLKVSEREYNYK